MRSKQITFNEWYDSRPCVEKQLSVAEVSNELFCVRGTPTTMLKTN